MTLSNAKLAARWGCFTSTYYGWRKGRPAFFELITVGAEKNENRTDYPLVSDEELQTLCNERGFTINDMCVAAEIARNSIKTWMRDEKYIKRFYDLLEGMHTHVLARV